MAAASPLNPKANYHIRSISLPSKPHPLFQQCEDYLLRIIASSDANSSSSSAISNKLSCLLDLHNCVNELFQLPLTQEAFVRERNEKWVDELLDRSLRLLDVCTAAKDALIHTKECAREIQSTMRRRRGGQSGFTNEVKKYFASRKVVKKAICKALVTLKSCEKKSSFSSTNKDSVAVALVSVLREVEAVSLTVFESLLSFISGSKAQSKMMGWSFVSKIMLNKKVACDEEKSEVNEFADVDAALSCLVGQETSKSDNISCNEDVQSDLQQLESCSQDLEEGLECLFRRLIKNRVSLLNTLSN
ncbi:hypothetical protein RchiOBHm_Chr6g0279931 [Rosa chinensis]|uniref:DUF241 domain protein n=1 Tax=Rosa chinensis TaxID=74649 RepID=A0A2P6PT49_ROSCH|nr:uncharacterized protein LOC112168849 [Rosa chinensis]PRQ25102.1 hypothetical protein RchiOBHm_Chr6g0279931 [Rosa chinensis]